MIAQSMLHFVERCEMSPIMEGLEFNMEFTIEKCLWGENAEFQVLLDQLMPRNVMSPFGSHVRPFCDRLSDHPDQALAQEPSAIAVGKV